jgi:LacI family transcriptional regulator
MTVSNVLRARAEEVSEQTRSRVMEAVRTLGYVPVSVARQNRHVETHLIGLVPYSLDVTETMLDTATYRGIYPAAREADYDLMLLLRSQNPLFAEREETRFLDRRCDGYLFVSPGIGEWNEVLRALARAQVPTVVLYRRNVPEGIAWVDPDNESIVAQGVERLHAAGHTRIGYLAGPREDYRDRDGAGNIMRLTRNFDSAARENAFVRLAPSGQVLTGVEPGWVVPETLLDSVLAKGITAVFAENAQLALPLLAHARARGLSVPDDLSILGVDDPPEAERSGLTTLCFGYETVGREAMATWLALKAGT